MGTAIALNTNGDYSRPETVSKESAMAKLFILASLVLVTATSLTAQPSEFTMALTGDSIITRRLSVYKEPEFLKMIELIRGADVAFTNVEVLFHDYEFYPMATSGGTWMRAQPEIARELIWAGFDLGSLANNHSGDYGPPAMLLTEKYVREAGLTAAGIGKSLSQAREGKFHETAKGRVALISVASTFTSHSIAGKSRDDIPARPGLNPLRYETTYKVSQEQLEALREIKVSLAINQDEEDSEDRLMFFQRRFVSGNFPDVLTKPNATDLAEIAVVVRNASHLAEYTIVTIHAHEGDMNRFVPAQFLVTFARSMIDAGADVFVGHGPHVLRAIEIYKGKPILYSLGDFIFQNETLQRLPYENYARFGLGEDKGVADFNNTRYDFDRIGFPATPEIWEAVVALPAFKGNELVSLELHPISLGFGKPPSVRGRPMLADKSLSRKIIGDLQRLSEPFGTQIDYLNGIGIVRLPEIKTK